MLEVNEQYPEELETTEKKKHPVVKIVVTLIVLIILCLCFRSCQARDEPILPDPDRTYEENVVTESEEVMPTQENKRLNIAISDSYLITEERPVFYIGYPEENVFDVVFILLDGAGNELYKTKYVAPGTNVAIDGSTFLKIGEHKIDCLVSIYNHDSGTLISDCTTIVLNINYE